MTSLTPDELVRYARHLSLREVGPAGQERLKQARVLLIGAGGLGSPAALYLAAAGVGTLGVVDFDRVDATNLQRQVLHGTAAIGRSKLDSARDRLVDLNPSVAVEMLPLRLDSSNALETLARYDFALDGSDNFATRYLVNDASVLLRKPYVYGSILRFDGQVSVFAAPGGPCYRCLFAEPPPPELVPSCAVAGVLGVLPGVIGTLMAVEAIKLILGIGQPLIGRLVLYEALGVRFRELAVQRDPSCPACGEAPTIRELIDYEAFCAGPSPVAQPLELAPAELAARLASAARPVVIDVREEWEWQIARIPGSTHVPLAELPERLAEFDPTQELVLVCHRGARSLAAVTLAASAGFGARSLRGGIDAWAVEVDPSLPRY